MMTTAGSFSDASGSLFNGDLQSVFFLTWSVMKLVFWSSYKSRLVNGVMTSSLKKPTVYFEVCNSPSSGTLVFSGYLHSGAPKVYIITQNSNWNPVESYYKYLDSFQIPGSGSRYHGFGVVEQDDKIYLLGGSIGTTGRFLIHGALCYYSKFPSDVWKNLQPIKNHPVVFIGMRFMFWI